MTISAVIAVTGIFPLYSFLIYIFFISLSSLRYRSHAILTLHVESRVPTGENYGEGEMSATSMHAFSASSPMSTDGEGSFLGAESPSGLRINVEGNAGI
jgi:hypothetical protein